jgi:hypothetical protein
MQRPTTKNNTERPSRAVNISVAVDWRKDKIIQKGSLHHQRTGFWPLHVARTAVGTRPNTETGPTNERVVCAYRSARRVQVLG